MPLRRLHLRDALAILGLLDPFPAWGLQLALEGTIQPVNVAADPCTD